MRTKFSGILTLVLVFVVQLTFAQEKTVSGLVADDNAIPLPGVDVVVKGTDRGTQTDFDGKYTIEVSPSDVLVFKYLGFQTQEVAVGNNTTINANLVSDTEVLEDVVVTAYGGILKGKDVVSAVSTVKSEALEQIPFASVDQILQGQVAGANIRAASGQPGQAATTIIRGRTSLNGNTSPLYVVDGMPINERNFRAINPNDIESVNVLKDAAGTAIYGNRGAAGVIIVTTKNAKRNSGLQIKYRGFYGQRQNPDANFRMMNAQEKMFFSRDVVGSGFGSDLSDQRINAIANQTNTNWGDILFQTGKTESHEVNLQQGAENLSSFTSLQYFEQEGTTLRSKLQRFSFRNNLEGGDDKFNWGTNVQLTFSRSDFVVDATRGGNTGGDLDNPFIVPFLGMPWLNPRNADGSLNIVGTRRSGALNPDGSLSVSGANGFLNTPHLALNTQSLNTDQENEIRALVGGNLNYKISDKFQIGGNANIDYISTQQLQIDAPNSLRGLLSPNQQAAEEEFGGFQREGYFRDFSFNAVGNIRYNDRFGAEEKHSLSAGLFTEFFYQNVQFASFDAFGLNPKFPGSSTGFVDPRTTVLDDEGEETYPFVPNLSSLETDFAILSYFTNVSYDYDERFGADLTIRRDGTSRFQDDYRWGTFFSLGGRWNIDTEEFMEDVDWVDALKLRASYGETGNQNITGGTAGGAPQNLLIPNFFPGYQQYAGGPGYQNNQQLVASGLADTQVQWETTKMFNLGVDFGLWNNKLTGALDVYKKETEDLYFGRNLSTAGTGFGSTSTNVGDMTNTGLEVQLAYDILRKSATSDWSLNVYANVAWNENEVTNIDNEQGFVEGGSRARIQEGERAYTYFMQRWAGVNPADGRPLYLTADGELTTDYDRDEHGVYTDKQFDPVWQGGFGLKASWKQLSLNTLWTWQYDAWRVNGTYALTEDLSTADFANNNRSLLNSWSEPGDVTGIPAPRFGGLRFQDGDRYLEDASFLRLRNVNLAYTFDQTQLERLGFINGLRFFVQGTNLLTFSKWRGFDPETSVLNDFFTFPAAMEVSAGVDITF
ncbi:MAG: SusC/RagA family TonB-linked outer membrane protein [Psychroflexus maritimus]